jgi:hypothetical protein
MFSLTKIEGIRLSLSVISLFLAMNVDTKLGFSLPLNSLDRMLISLFILIFVFLSIFLKSSKK